MHKGVGEMHKGFGGCTKGCTRGWGGGGDARRVQGVHKELRG